MTTNIFLPSTKLTALIQAATGTEKLTNKLSDNLQLGQVIQATVVKVPTPNQVVIKINNQTLTAQTNGLQLQPGQEVKLQITQLGDGVHLKVMPQPQAPRQVQSTLVHAVRQNISQQNGLAPLLANLNALSQTSTRINLVKIPETILQQAENLIKQLPSISQVSKGSGVQRTIQQSGIFLEPKIAKAKLDNSAPPQIRQDLKANLIRLRDSIVQHLQNSNRTSSGTTGPSPDKHAQPLPQANNNTPILQSNTSASSTGQAKTTTQSPNNNTSLPTINNAPMAKPQATTSSQTGQTVINSNDIKDPLLRATTDTRSHQSSSKPTTTSTTPTTPPPITSTNQGKQLNMRGHVVPAFRGSPQAQPATTPSVLNLLGLDDVLGELLTQVTASLARVQLHQLSNVATDSQQLNTWVFEVPVQDHNRTDVFHLTIQEEDANAEEEGAPHLWRVNLAFDLPNLGPVHIQLVLKQQSINTIIWAEQLTTKEYIDKEMNKLQHALEEAGIEVNNIQCHHGQAPKQRGFDPFTLVDTQA